MKYLKDILEELQITNDDSLKKYIDSNYNDQSQIPLKIIRNSDLRLDVENRIYDDKIEYRKTIFDVENLKILNSVDIHFQDCIFMGSLRVSNKDISSPTKIFIDTVIIKNELKVTGANNISECTISRVNCPELNILNNDLISDFSISLCNIGLMTIYHAKIENFIVNFNRIEHFESSYSIFGKVSFSKDQVNIGNHKLAFKKSKQKNIIKKHKSFQFININFEKESREENISVANETSEFLLSNSDYHLNRSDQAWLKYISGLASLPNPFKRFIYRIAGGLVLPYRIVLLMVATTIIFSLLYYFSGTQFSISNTSRPLCFSEAMYFSGISFTTIGFGDIAPLSYLRYIAIFEGVIGIILSSAFVVSLTRKYIE